MKPFLSLTGRVILLMALSATAAFAQPKRLQFRHLTPDDGLSSSTVTCILQDSRGFMWIGTYYGLNRYDGYSFDVYNNDLADSTSLPHNLVWTVYEDSRKDLFIGTSAGLCRYDWKTNSFIDYMDDPAGPLNAYKYGVLDMAEDSLGNFWLATGQGLVYFDRKNNKAVRYNQEPGNPESLSYYNVECVFIDSQNNLWVSTRKGLNVFHPETGTFEHVLKTRKPGTDLSNVFFIDIAEDREGNLWFGSYGAGLFRLDPRHRDSRLLINYRHDPRNGRSLSADRIHSLFIDRQDNVWVGTENGGLNGYDRATDSFIHFRSDDLDRNSLNNESIYSIYEDRTGNFWIGTYAGGINISRKNGDAIFNYSKISGAPASLSHNSVTSFLHDSRGRIWVATDGGGLNRFDPESGRFTRTGFRNSKLSSDAVLSVVEGPGGLIWVGTWGGGLNRFNPASGSFKSFTTRNSRIPDDNIHSIAVDGKGDLWMASFQHGLIRYRKNKNAFTAFSSKNSGISISIVSVVAVAPDGRILAGTPSGFNIFNPDTRSFETYFHVPSDASSISDNSVLCFAVENDTSVWIGTGNGLNRFNPRTKKFARFSSRNGLPDDVIKAMVFDVSGRLWLSTNKGLCRFNVKKGECKIFTKADGLQSNEFNLKSACRMRDGRLLFGGTNGFNLIYPGKITENRNVPGILITDLLVFNKPSNTGTKNSPLDMRISPVDPVTLSFEQSVFTLFFSAMDYTMPEKNRYAYMLEGFDRDWNDVGTRRSATYTNIDPGKYVFKVKGSNNDGVWNETGASLRITILPPFWRAWWFQGAGLLALAGLVFVSYKMRTARMRARNRELEQRVAERTVQLETTNRELEAFTYSVSHDLRAPLRGMAGFSQMLLDDYSGKIDARGKDYLQRIQAAGHRMGNLIDDLLKLSRLTRSEMHFTWVNLSELVESILQEHLKANPERRVAVSVARGLMVEGDAPLLEVMLRNLIGNAWKFTSRTPDSKIEFGAAQKDGTTIYHIRDNGVGFDQAYSEKLFEVFQRQHADFEGTGIGLATVRRVIHRHGGQIWAEGIVNKGAAFFFTLGRKP